MVRTRFAPSPTGYLHIGGLRTALYAYMFAKKNNGKFILRIEDTDLARYVDGATDAIYRAMHAAGIDYDEGPDVGGEFAPYVQSERKDIYTKYAQQLIENGAAYYCFCSKQTLEDMHKQGAVKYDKRCSRIPLSEAKARVAAGEPYVIRQNLPEKGVTSFNDEVFGTVTVDYKDLEDNVLIKSDGYPTYNFANVVDDHLMQITHCIRGVEYLMSTPKYNALYAAFGWTPPVYIHLQPIMRDEKRKLSKRDGAVGFEEFLAKGFLPQAIVNYIALLGWNPKDNREKMTLDEMIDAFSIEGISKSSSIFDENKMRWLNSLYLKELSPEEYARRSEPYFKECFAGMDFINRETAARLSLPRAETFSDMNKLFAFVKQFDDFDLNNFVNQKQKTDVNLAKQILPDLIKCASNNFDSIDNALIDYAAKNELKKGQALWIFRIALTGAQSTPGGCEDMAKLFGKTESLRRLNATLNRLK